MGFISLGILVLVPAIVLAVFLGRRSRNGDGRVLLGIVAGARLPLPLVGRDRPAALNRAMPKVGIEPTRPEGHRILSPARLPVPPLRPATAWYVPRVWTNTDVGATTLVAQQESLR
jgi:hypothetical protein